VAKTLTVPMNPTPHCATPSCVMEARPKSGTPLKAGWSTVQMTPGRGLILVGLLLKVPLAVKMTCPFANTGSALAGVTETKTRRRPLLEATKTVPPHPAARHAAASVRARKRRDNTSPPLFRGRLATGPLYQD